MNNDPPNTLSRPKAIFRSLFPRNDLFCHSCVASLNWTVFFCSQLFRRSCQETWRRNRKSKSSRNWLPFWKRRPESSIRRYRPGLRQNCCSVECSCLPARPFFRICRSILLLCLASQFSPCNSKELSKILWPLNPH